jgi:hypothetical protein
MANKKFSQFNQLSTPSANTEIVGFDGSNNIRLLASALGGGGGKEPFIDDTFVTTNLINSAGGNQNFVQEHGRGESYGVPFMLQQDATLKQIALTQQNASSTATNGYIGLYEYASKSGANFTFNKVYQEEQTFDLSGSLAGTLQRITLTTNQTLDAGKIYLVMVMHDNNITNSAIRPTYQGFRQLNQSKILGNLSASSIDVYRTLFTSATIVSGTLPSTVTSLGLSNFNQSKGGFYILTLQNA